MLIVLMMSITFSTCHLLSRNSPFWFGMLYLFLQCNRGHVGVSFHTSYTAFSNRGRMKYQYWKKTLSMALIQLIRFVQCAECVQSHVLVGSKFLHQSAMHGMMCYQGYSTTRFGYPYPFASKQSLEFNDNNCLHKD